MRARAAEESAVRMVAQDWWRADINESALVIDSGSRNLMNSA
jgi:hypothetical protein